MAVACYTTETRNKHMIYVRSSYDTNNIRIKSQRKNNVIVLHRLIRVRDLLLFKVNCKSNHDENRSFNDEMLISAFY
jgi:hypothetical protein